MIKRKYRNKEDWKILIEAQLKSGLNASQFCRQQQVSAKYFSKRKVEYLRHTDKLESPSAFVKIEAPVQTLPSASIQLHYNNASLQIPSSVDSTWLGNLLRVLP